MPVSARRRRAAAVALPAAGTLAVALLAALPAHAATSNGRAQLADTHPSWATASADRGALAGATRLSATVYLASRNPSGLAAYAQAVSTPGNASYAKYLTASQALAEYGPSPAAVSAVESWLRADGVTITASTPQALTISGTASQLDAAFSTRLDVYRTSTGTHHAPATAAQIPAALSGAVLGVEGLSDVQPLSKVDSAKSSDAGTPSPTNACSTYWGQYTATGVPAGYTATTPTDPCGYYPAQLRKAYGISATGLTGRGATIAIVDAYDSTSMLADANQYATNHGDKAFRTGQYTEYVTPSAWQFQNQCGDWAPEQSLDVEMSHGLAPDANVVYVGANSCQDSDLLAANALIVDKHLADVVSNSWGGIMHSTSGATIDPTEIAAYNQVFEQGAAEGIGFNFSAGDCGDNSPAAAATGANCDPTSAVAQTQWPASDQWATAVGGTMLAISQPSGTYGFEGSMGNLRSVLTNGAWTPLPGFFYFGGGGGTSQDFTQPWYQRFAVPYATSHTLMTGATTKTAMRTIPDVSMDGDLYTSVLVGISDGSPYSEAGYGGTSVSSPSFAAVIADAIQARGGRPVGFANPALYLRQGLYHDVKDTPAQLSAVFQITPQRIRLLKFQSDTSLKATRGYDTATGLGSPDAAFLESFSWWGPLGH